MSAQLKIKKLAEANNQGHIFTFWNELSCDEQNSLLKSTVDIDFCDLNRQFSSLTNLTDLDKRLSPPNPDSCGSFTELRQFNQHVLDKYAENTLKSVSEGKVAVLLLAGGQGTRLGVSFPKGMYKPNLPSGRSLYQLQAEKLRRVCRISGELFGGEPWISWYIMTSEHTKEMTKKYFEKHNYFGYKSDRIVFFEQYNIPVFSLDGKILLKSKSKVHQAPDGNGGLYKALRDRGILNHMQSQGIEYVQIYCVDNILVKLPDLHFIGFCIDKSSDCAAQVVQKVDQNEPIGVVGMVDGRYQVVEYSEISPSTAALRLNSENPYDESNNVSKMNGNENKLLYNHGNICVHFMTRSFLEQVTQEELLKSLKYHRARKCVTHIDLESGQQIVPSEPNAIKLEKFVFDVFPFSKNFAIWEVPRNEYFSPLKNGPNASKYNPKTCRADLLHYHSQLAKKAGAILPSPRRSTVDGDDSCESSNSNGCIDLIEISPLVSYDGENLSCLKGLKITGPIRLELDETDTSSESVIIVPAEN